MSKDSLQSASIARYELVSSVQGFIVKTAIATVDFRRPQGRNALVRAAAMSSLGSIDRHAERNETSLHPGEGSA